MTGTTLCFEPHPWFRGGHAQTVLGRYWPDRHRSGELSPIVESLLTLPDGDRLRVLETVPEGWQPDTPAAVLVHGLAGCAESPFVRRLAARLVNRGIRVVRVNLRNAGSGFGLARRIYHAGRSDDVRAVVQWLAERAPGSPIALVGFSLGGNLVLKLAAEAAEEPLVGLDCVLAASPPLDLAACCRYLRRPAGRLYDLHFLWQLRGTVRRLHALYPELGPDGLEGVRGLYAFDDAYTAPRNGFASALDYYERCSAGPLLGRIEVPGLILHAADDPFIPLETFGRVQCPGRLELELLPAGGHLGFVSRHRHDGDHRWLEARFAAWLIRHWELSRTHVRGIVSQGQA